MTRSLRHWTRAARAALLLAFAIASPGIAQLRPVGAPPMSVEAVQDRLGPCPIEELREAWSDMEGVERAAVEAEVIRLCTERAVLVGELLAAHRDLRAALGPLVPELPAPVVAPAAVEAAEILGAGSAGAETAAEAVETPDVGIPGAEAAAVEPDIAAGGDVPPDASDPVADVASTAGPGGAGEPFGQLADILGLEGGADAPGRSGDAGGDPSLRTLPPPGAALPEDEPGQATVLDGAAAPVEPAEPSWEVLFTVKRSDGKWLAMIRETNPPPLVLPALATADGDAPAPPVFAPRPPESVLVSEDELLAEDGPVVVRIDRAGVEISPRSDGESEVLPWATGAPALEPGRPDFLYVKEGE